MLPWIMPWVHTTPICMVSLNYTYKFGLLKVLSSFYLTDCLVTIIIYKYTIDQNIYKQLVFLIEFMQSQSTNHYVSRSLRKCVTSVHQWVFYLLEYYKCINFRVVILCNWVSVLLSIGILLTTVSFIIILLTY